MFKGMDYVYELYKERNFSRAADNMFISQPSLSANIKRVEEKVGYPLFDRSTKPIELTPVGEQYIKTIEQIRMAEHEFESFITDLAELKTGKIVFGGSNFFSSWVLPEMLARFSAQYPDVTIELMESRSVRLAQALQDASIDFLLDNKELDLDVFDRHIMGEEELLLVVPKSFKANEGLENYRIDLEDIRSGAFKDESFRCVDLEYFAGSPFVLLRSFNDTGRRAELICQEHNFKPNVVLNLDQQLTAYNVASSGVGIAFTGEILLRSVPANPNLVYYKLSSKYKTRSIYFYWKKGRYISNAMKVFLDSIIYNTDFNSLQK